MANILQAGTLARALVDGLGEPGKPATEPLLRTMLSSKLWAVGGTYRDGDSGSKFEVRVHGICSMLYALAVIQLSQPVSIAAIEVLIGTSAPSTRACFGCVHPC